MARYLRLLLAPDSNHEGLLVKAGFLLAMLFVSVVMMVTLAVQL